MRNEARISVPMHQDAQLRMVTLDHVLSAVAPRDLEWRVTALEAMSMPESGINILELEATIDASAEGILFSDDALRDLASRLDQTINCNLVGTTPGGDSVISIEAFDSTGWTIRYDTDQVQASAQLLGDHVIH